MRNQHRKVFKVDHKATPCRARWEVVKASGYHSEPKILNDMRKALSGVAALPPPEEPGGHKRGSALARFVVLGLRAVERAVERGDALVVVVCTEGVPSLLVQHLPVICTLRNVSIAMLAATPPMLASAIGAPRSTRRGKAKDPGAVAAAFLQACTSLPALAEFCREAQLTLPAPKLPFLLPSSLQQAPPRPAPTAAEAPGSKAAAPGQAAGQVGDDVIMLPPPPRERASPRRSGTYQPRSAAAQVAVRTAAALLRGPSAGAARSSGASAGVSAAGRAEPSTSTGNAARGRQADGSGPADAASKKPPESDNAASVPAVAAVGGPASSQLPPGTSSESGPSADIYDFFESMD